MRINRSTAATAATAESDSFPAFIWLFYSRLHLARVSGFYYCHGDRFNYLEYKLARGKSSPRALLIIQPFQSGVLIYSGMLLWVVV